MKPKAKIRLGDLLVQHSIINEEQLMQALAAQKESGRKLGFMLIELGVSNRKSAAVLFVTTLRCAFNRYHPT